MLTGSSPAGKVPAAVEGQRWISITEAKHFTDRARDGYAGRLDEQQVMEYIATAAGALGTSADYLFETVAQLEQLGVRDRDLERLRRAVRRRLDLA